MPFEIIHFRRSQEILAEKEMETEIQTALEYIDLSLYGASNKGRLLKECLKEMGWREKDQLNIIEGRKYKLLGMKQGIAICGNLSSYEAVLDGLFRFQIAHDKGIVDTGLLILPALRSINSKFGSSRELCEWEIEKQLSPTISVPVSVALFELGESNKKEREDLTELRRKHNMTSPSNTDQPQGECVQQ